MAKARKRFGGGPAMRLPKAIQAILSNYRGTRVSGIPRSGLRRFMTGRIDFRWRAEAPCNTLQDIPRYPVVEAITERSQP